MQYFVPSLCNRPIDASDAVQDPYDWAVAEALLHDLLKTSTGGTVRDNIDPTGIIIIWENVLEGCKAACSRSMCASSFDFGF